MLRHSAMLRHPERLLLSEQALVQRGAHLLRFDLGGRRVVHLQRVLVLDGACAILGSIRHRLLILLVHPGQQRLAPPLDVLLGRVEQRGRLVVPLGADQLEVSAAHLQNPVAERRPLVRVARQVALEEGGQQLDNPAGAEELGQRGLESGECGHDASLVGQAVGDCLQLEVGERLRAVRLGQLARLVGGEAQKLLPPLGGDADARQLEQLLVHPLLRPRGPLASDPRQLLVPEGAEGSDLVREVVALLARFRASSCPQAAELLVEIVAGQPSKRLLRVMQRLVGKDVEAARGIRAERHEVVVAAVGSVAPHKVVLGHHPVLLEAELLAAQEEAQRCVGGRERAGDGRRVLDELRLLERLVPACDHAGAEDHVV
mmetsp:Transcript_30060/g.91525  ORF Transcript_30060/g.91525 Transcript_30060/m.91525 type:complete len:373 (-) Transcript_30060:1012-2130(-)